MLLMLTKSSQIWSYQDIIILSPPYCKQENQLRIQQSMPSTSQIKYQEENKNEPQQLKLENPRLTNESDNHTHNRTTKVQPKVWHTKSFLAYTSTWR